MEEQYFMKQREKTPEKDEIITKIDDNEKKKIMDDEKEKINTNQYNKKNFFEENKEKIVEIQKIEKKDYTPQEEEIQIRIDKDIELSRSPRREEKKGFGNRFKIQEKEIEEPGKKK